MQRASGVLMHITSLPGKFGIGTFGESAYKFVDFLVETKQTYWQILPLTTTSYGDSPYQSFSAVAGNTNLIDFNKLVEENLLLESDFSDMDFSSNEEEIDYELLFNVRRPILEKAVYNFLINKNNVEKLNVFIDQNKKWLIDFAEYMAIKEYFGYKSLSFWTEDIRKNEESARENYREKLVDKINYYIPTSC